MSDVKHSFRITIFDIEKEKVVLDEFCDAVVAGIAKNGSKPGSVDAKEFAACRCGISVSVGAVLAAEKVIMTHKKEVVKEFLEKATPEMIKECFGGENEDEC